MNRTICLLLFFAALINVCAAQNIRGAEFSYASISGNKYHVTLKVYTFCSDNVEKAYDIYETSKCGTKDFTLTKVSSTEISQTCDGVCTNCTQITCPNHGFIESVYAGDIVLRNDTCCIRHLNLRILGGRENLVYRHDTFFMDCMINTCLTSKNNSVTFNLVPLTNWQPNKVFFVSHGAFDPDFDSLKYEIAWPRTDSNTIFKGDQSLIRSLKIDNLTGLITYTGKFAVGWVPVKITEYRNKQKVGYVWREIQYFALKRNKKNAVPLLSGVNNTTKNTIDFCMGTENCFTISSSDSNISDSVFLLSSDDMPGLSFITDTNQVQSATICWNPDPKTVTKSSYNLTVRAFDNGCPYNYYSDRIYSVNIFQATAKPSNKVDSCGIANFTSNIKILKGDPKKIGIKWQGDDGLSSEDTSFQHHYSGKGNYFYSMTLYHKKTNCILFRDSGFVTINLATAISLPSDTIACADDTILVSPLHVSGNGLLSYFWSTGDTTKTAQIPVLGTKLYTLKIIDQAGCSDSDEFNITMRNPVSLGKLIDSTVCAYSDTLILRTIPNGGKWTGKLIKDDSLIIPTLTDTNLVFNIEYIYNDEYSCNSRKTYRIIVLPYTKANGGVDVKICANQGAYELEPISKGMWSPYPKIKGNTLQVRNLDLGENVLKYILINEFGCLSIDTVLAHVLNPPIVKVSMNDTLCQNKTIELLGYPSSGKWVVRGDTLPNRFFQPSKSDTGWLKVYYIGKDEHNCADTTLKDLYIVAVPGVEILGMESAYCLSDDSFQVVGNPGGGIFSGNALRSKNNGTYFVPSIVGLGETLIVYEFDNNNFCPSYDSVWIKVNEPPLANFEYYPMNYTLPITIKFSDLSMGNPVKWNWRFGIGSKDTSIKQFPSFVFSDTLQNSASLVISDSNNCSDSISKRISLSGFIGLNNYFDREFNLRIDHKNRRIILIDNLYEKQAKRITIYSVDGKVIDQFIKKDDMIDISFSDMPYGNYIIGVSSHNIEQLFRVVL